MRNIKRLLCYAFLFGCIFQRFSSKLLFIFILMIFFFNSEYAEYNICHWTFRKQLSFNIPYICNLHFRGSMDTISIKLNMFHFRSLESRFYSILLKVKPSLICNQIFNPKWVKNRDKIWFVYGNKSLQFKRYSFCCEKFMIQNRWVLDREYYSTMNQKTEKG